MDRSEIEHQLNLLGQQSRRHRFTYIPLNELDSSCAEALLKVKCVSGATGGDDINQDYGASKIILEQVLTNVRTYESRASENDDCLELIHLPHSG
jgi:hypothetical protein